MALASLRDPQAGAYIIQDLCETPETLDLGRLQRAWHTVAARHPALRTVVEMQANQPPVQRIDDCGPIQWNETDCPDDLEAFLCEDRARGFDFAQGVTMRMTLLHRPGGASVLVWTSHHVLLDAQAYLTVWNEWLALYDNPSAVLPDPVPFDAYLDWLETLAPDAPAPFWRRHLQDVARTTDFIVDRLRAPERSATSRIAREGLIFTEEETAALRSFARRHDLTVSTLLQAAWALLLSRYANTLDPVFGVTLSGRSSGPPGAAKIVGPLINTLPFHVTVDPQACVLPWLRHVREQMLAVREYQHTPLARFREWNILPAGSAPFDTLFVYEYQRLGDSLRNLGGNWRHRAVTRVQHTDTRLTLSAVGYPRLSLTLIYDTRIFCRETMAGLAGHWRTLIEAFTAQPESHLSELCLLTAQERARVQARNQTQTPAIANLCAHQLFERTAERWPDATAIDHAGETISFAELNRRANRLAAHLRELGVAPDDFIGVQLNRSPEAVVAILAVLKAGAAFVPLSADLPEARLTAMLQDVRPKLVLASEDLHKIPGHQPDSNPPCLARPDHAAYVAFTSGSTGRPKAAVLTHRALANYAQALGHGYGLTPRDRRLQFASLGSDMFVSEVFTFLCAGAALVFCMNPAGNSIAEFLQLIEAHRITVTGLPASWWSAWVSAIESGAASVPPTLRIVIAGMERLDPAALASFRRAAGNRIQFFNAYGPSEACPVSTLYQAGSSPWETASHVPIGRAVANTRVYLLDEFGNPVPDGVTGELYIGGQGVARGYLNAPDLNAAKFLPDPFAVEPDKLMFRTGDRAFSLPDGNLVFLGRTDRQVKIRGFRVELEEIEAVLAEHPDVRQCAVIADQQTILAFLTAAGVAAPADHSLRRHLLARLPAYMMPARFNILPDMPLNPNGKIDRNALPALDRQVDASDSFVEPSTPLERSLASLWQDALHLPQVSAKANFFESGGDSLRATQLVLRIQREFGKDLPFALFLRAPTVVQTALFLESAVSSQSGEIMLRYSPHGTRLPLFNITSNAGDLYVFRHVANRLHSEQPMFVLNVPAAEHEGVQPVEELAARICRSIREARPQGPYILGGYCFGGILAFEAARQLIAAGEQVPLVALFDTPAPGYPRLLGSRRIAAHVRSLGRSGKRSELPLIQRAARDYAPQCLDAAVAQFMAADPPVSTRLLEDPRLAWRSLCRGPFQTYRVPGDHITWLQEPNAKETAARLMEALNSAISRFQPAVRSLPTAPDPHCAPG